MGVARAPSYILHRRARARAGVNSLFSEISFTLHAVAIFFRFDGARTGELFLETSVISLALRGSLCVGRM